MHAKSLTRLPKNYCPHAAVHPLKPQNISFCLPSLVDSTATWGPRSSGDAPPFVARQTWAAKCCSPLLRRAPGSQIHRIILWSWGACLIHSVMTLPSRLQRCKIWKIRLLLLQRRFAWCHIDGFQPTLSLHRNKGCKFQWYWCSNYAAGSVAWSILKIISIQELTKKKPYNI